jgi:hypothetical protein
MNWQPLDLTSPGYAVMPEPPSLAGLVYAGKRHLVSGPPESLKTMLCYLLALEHIRAGGVVGIVDLEMGPAAARLLLGELGATPEELKCIYYVEPEAPPTPGDLEAMLAARVTLAIVDAAAGAYGLSGLDDNKRQDAERFARTWLDPLWKRGTATLTVDHVTKDAEVRGKYAIGSERKVGGADVHLGLHVVKPLSRGGSGLVRIDAHKDRPGFLTRPVAAELELESEPYTHAIAWTFREPASSSSSSGGFRPTVLMDRVLDFVNRNEYEPTSRSPLADAVPGKRTFVLQAIDELLAEGRLARVGKTIVPVPGTFPEPGTSQRGTENVPRSSPPQGGTTRGTTFGAADDDPESS